MSLAEDQNMIQTVAPKRSDQAIGVWVLPRSSRRYWVVANTHRPNSAQEWPPVGTIIVTHQIDWRRVPRKCGHHLLRQPFRCWTAGDRKPEQLAPSVPVCAENSDSDVLMMQPADQ